MKRLIAALCVLASLASAPAAVAQTRAACEGTPGGAQLIVQVTNVRPTGGQVAVTIYPDVRRRFLAPRGKLLRQRVTAGSPSSQACFNLPAGGVYAIAIYHDANANSDFDRRLGVPTEGFGFSNDAPANFALPSFPSVRFTVPAGQSTTRIRMRYPDEQRRR